VRRTARAEMEPTTAEMHTIPTKVDTPTTETNTTTAEVDTAAADMSSAATPTEMRPAAVDASSTTASSSHRVDWAGEGQDGCQEEGSESNSAMCHSGLLGAKAASPGEPVEATHRVAMNYFCCWLLALAWVEAS
jgi:hypothetical protein